MASTQAKIEAAIAVVREALNYAERKHGLKFASPHEAHSVILEEYEELWEHVRADTGRTPDAATEASHLAAMAIKYMINFDPRFTDERRN
jgi:hypothetical protein